MDTNLNAVELAAMSWCDYDGYTVARYKKLQQELVDLTATLEHVQSVIRVITDGLPENIRVRTVTQFTEYDGRQPTRVFQLQDGAWKECGSIVTEGASCPFYGDGGFVTSDSELVITDRSSGFGISVGDELEFVNLDSPEEARQVHAGMYGGHEGTLSMLERATSENGVIRFDCMWP